MDYNIYIHSDSTGSESGNKTSPWQPAETTDTGGFKSSNLAQKALKAVNAARNPDGIVSSSLEKGAKAFPWVAVAFAVLKLTDNAITNAMSFYTTETGDYRFSTQYNNFKQGLRGVLLPVSTSINYLKQVQQIRIDNERKSASRELLGDDIITGGSFYGV